MNKWFVSLIELKNRYEQRRNTANECVFGTTKKHKRKNCVPLRPALSSRSFRFVSNPTANKRKTLNNTKKTNEFNFFEISFSHTHTIHRNCVLGNCFFIAPSKGITAGSILNATNEIFNEFTRLFVYSSHPAILSFAVFVHKTNAYICRADVANWPPYVRNLPTQSNNMSKSKWKIHTFMEVVDLTYIAILSLLSPVRAHTHTPKFSKSRRTYVFESRTHMSLSRTHPVSGGSHLSMSRTWISRI